MKCPTCNTANPEPKCACWRCGNNLVPEAACPPESGSPSSAWVAEWEAALSKALKAGVSTPALGLDPETWDKVIRAQIDLEEIVNAARRHSATK